MPLSSVCEELHQIALLTAAEHQIIRCMRRNGEEVEAAEEARCLAAGIAQIWLLRGPLIDEALRLETASAWVA